MNSLIEEVSSITGMVENYVIEGVLPGDRRISKVIYDAYKMGCIYDS